MNQTLLPLKRHATPYYKETKEKEVGRVIWLAFLTGCLCGASVVLGVM